MAYDESTFRRRDTGSGEPVDLRDDSRLPGAPSYQPDSYREDYPEPGPPGGRHASLAGADDAFDDPEHGEPGRDQMAVHLGWEAVLLVAAIGLGVLLYRDQPDALRGDGLNSMLVYGSALGLLVLAAGLTLRAGAPNLALGTTAMIAALYFAHEGERGALFGTVVAIGVATVAGLLLAVFVTGLHVPAWAASLAAALAGTVWIQQVDGPVQVTGDYNPDSRAFYLFGGFAVLAVLGGLLGTIKTIRRAVGRFRPVADPARRRGGLAAVLTALNIVVSMVLAAAAGVIFAADGRPSVTPSPGFELTGLALGAALLGGASVFGRRGGVFGTLLAVVLSTLFIRYDEARGWDISLFAIAAAAIAAGLAISRMVETYGRPGPGDDLPEAEAEDRSDDGEWVTTTPSGTAGFGAPAPAGWSSYREPWSSAPPERPVSGRGATWDEDRWGAPPQ